jgi:hypothetical protein
VRGQLLVIRQPLDANLTAHGTFPLYLASYGKLLTMPHLFIVLLYGAALLNPWFTADAEEICQASKDEKNAVTITAVSPTQGNRPGGTLVTITGNSFKPGARILFGKSACTGVSILNDSKLTCKTGPGTLGLTNVVVINPDNSCGLLANAFSYVPSVKILPKNKKLALGGLARFAGAKGKPPYRYSLVFGTGSIDPDSGTYTAMDKTGIAVVRVTDSTGASDEALIELYPELKIQPETALVFTQHDIAFSVTGGAFPYSYSITNGTKFGSIDPTVGIFKANKWPGQATVSVTDNNGTEINATVDIRTEPLVFSNMAKVVVIGNSLQLKGASPPIASTSLLVQSLAQLIQAQIYLPLLTSQETSRSL